MDGLEELFSTQFHSRNRWGIWNVYECVLLHYTNTLYILDLIVDIQKSNNQDQDEYKEYIELKNSVSNDNIMMNNANR